MTFIIRSGYQSPGARFFKNITGLQSVPGHFIFFFHKIITVMHIYLTNSLSIIHQCVIIFAIPTQEDSQICLAHCACELSLSAEGWGSWFICHRHVRQCSTRNHTHTYTPLDCTRQQTRSLVFNSGKRRGAKSLHSIVLLVGTAKNGCKRTKYDWLPIRKAALSAYLYKLVQFV